jgi:hypothetical protein
MATSLSAADITVTRQLSATSPMHDRSTGPFDDNDANDDGDWPADYWDDND